MNSINDSPYQPHPINQKPNSSFKSLKPLALLTILILIALVAGTGGYLLGEKATDEKITQISLRITPTTTLEPTFTNLPTPTPIPCPPAPPEGEPSQTYTWKTYICQSLGVSFLYPTNIKPGLFGNIVSGSSNYVQINYGMGYIFSITKFVTKQSLSDWLKQKNQNGDNLYLSKRIVTQTTFHGYPAYSVEQTQENIEGQAPVNLYLVKVSPTTIYDIEYDIPDPRYPQDAQDNYLLTVGTQKILDSITFLTAQ